MKRCFKCLRDLPLSEFYRHHMMADGHLSKCKDCARSDVMKHRLQKIEDVRAYDRNRSALPHRKALRRRVAEQWRVDNPQGAKAVHQANNAVRDGRLVREERCEGCNKAVSIQKHHPDYSKPLLVVWLCKPCHAIADKIRRRLEAS